MISQVSGDLSGYHEECGRRGKKLSKRTVKGFEETLDQLATASEYLKAMLARALSYTDLVTNGVDFGEQALQSLRVFIVTVIYLSNMFCGELPVDDVLFDGQLFTIQHHQEQLDALEESELGARVVDLRAAD